MRFKAILRALNWGVITLFVLGGAALYNFTPDAIVSLKPAVSFDGLLEEGAEITSGMHISGRVPYVLDCFAAESAYTQFSNGMSSNSWATGKYYLLPTSGNFIALKSRQADVEALDALIDETWSHIMEGGAEPSTEFRMTGKTAPLEGRPAQYYREYLMEMGYTESELEVLGEPLVITRVNFLSCWVMTAVGLGLLFLGGLLFRSSYRVARYGYGHKPEEDVSDVPVHTAGGYSGISDDENV